MASWNKDENTACPYYFKTQNDISICRKTSYVPEFSSFNEVIFCLSVTVYFICFLAVSNLVLPLMVIMFSIYLIEILKKQVQNRTAEP